MRDEGFNFESRLCFARRGSCLSPGTGEPGLSPAPELRELNPGGELRSHILSDPPGSNDATIGPESFSLI